MSPRPERRRFTRNRRKTGTQPADQFSTAGPALRFRHGAGIIERAEKRFTSAEGRLHRRSPNLNDRTTARSLLLLLLLLLVLSSCPDIRKSTTLGSSCNPIECAELRRRNTSKYIRFRRVVILLKPPSDHSPPYPVTLSLGRSLALPLSVLSIRICIFCLVPRAI